MARGKIHTINLAVYPERLTVAPGDTIRVITEFDYVGPAQPDATMICAIFHPTLFDRHNEIVRGETAVPIPDSPLPGNHFDVTIDLLVPSGEIGTDYGLYSSVRHVTGPDIYCDPKWLENIITIEEVVPEFKGTISKMELDYDGSRAPIPVSNVPQGERGKVHIWGLNDMTIDQRMAISWVVKDPDGVVIEEYSDWQFGHASPDDTHEFISPTRFALNKEGTYTLAVGLFMNEAAPIQVDSYNGVLCTVVAAPPEEYTLEVAIEPPGAGHVLISPKAPYSAGTVVTLVATPNPGYEFDHWGGWPPYPGVGSTSSTLKLTMTADWWVVAAFREVAPPPEEYTLKVAIEPPATGHVLISPKAPYAAGEVVTLVATPYSGYKFDHWGGWPPYPGVDSTSPTLELTMTADWWVVAVFREKVPAQYTLAWSVRPSGSGTISPASGTKYPSGTSVTLRATPYSGYEFDHWGGAASGTSRTTTIVMDRTKWVEAVFREGEAPPPPPECTSGKLKCEGYDLYTCGADEKWHLTKRNSTQCGYTPPECTPGATKCIGYNLYTCGSDEKWHPTEKDSPQCGYTPPECTEYDLKCIGIDLYECRNGKWQLAEPNWPPCMLK